MAAVGMTACHTEYGEEMSRGEAYVSLTLQLPYAATRAVPQGGEEGDGREDGTDAENKVTDAWIFILRHAAGMDAPDIHGTYYLLHTLFLHSGHMQKESPA